HTERISRLQMARTPFVVRWLRRNQTPVPARGPKPFDSFFIPRFMGPAKSRGKHFFQFAAPINVRYKDAMKTLSITEARANLSAVLERVKKGEDIGIITGNKVIQLRQVEVVSWEVRYL